MNTVVVYDSQYGNTERIAQTIADALRAFGQAQAVRVDPARPVSLQEVDLLILGSPTQGLKPTLAMQSFVETVSFQQIRGLAVACFDTRFRGFMWKSSAAPHMANQLRTMGVEPLDPPRKLLREVHEGGGSSAGWGSGASRRLGEDAPREVRGISVPSRHAMTVREEHRRKEKGYGNVTCRKIIKRRCVCSRSLVERSLSGWRCLCLARRSALHRRFGA